MHPGAMMRKNQETNEKMDSLLLKVVSDTIENMAFMEVELASDKNKIHDDKTPLWFSLLVNEPVQGEFILSMPESVNKKIFENIYGPSEKGPDRNHMMDILAEILNTLVGRFMGAIVEKEELLKLGLPESGKGTYHEMDSPYVTWNFLVENECISIKAVGESLLKLLIKKTP